MNKALIVLIAMLAILGVFSVMFVAVYNSLVSADVAVDQSWSEVRNQYQRQADLIPNLVSTAKGYMQFEASLLTNLTNARTAWLNAAASSQLAQDEVGLEVTNAVGQWVFTVENYPELKSVDAILTLMDELAGTQNRVAVARGRYIERIGDYNRLTRSFPTNLVAGMFGYQQREYYVGEASEAPPPVVFP